MGLYFILLIPLIILTVFESIMRSYQFNYQSKSMPIDSGVYKGSTLLYVVVSILFIIFLGVRGLTGSDTISYNNFYVTGIYPGTLEKGYLWLSSFFAVHGFSFVFFEIIVALMTLFPLFIFYYKKTTSFSLTWLFFYLNGTLLYAMNISRQMLAATFFVFGVYLVITREKSNWICSILFFGVAVSFHKTSIIAIACLIPITIMYQLLMKKNNMRYVFAIGLFIAIVFFYKSNYIYNLLTQLGNSGSLNTYNGFVTDTSAEQLFTGRNLPTLLSTLLETTILLIPQDKKTIHDKFNQFLLSIFILLIFIQATQINWISERLSQFFLPFTAVLVPRLVMYGKKMNVRKGLILLLFLLAVGIQFYRMVVHNFGTIYPYLGI